MKYLLLILGSFCIGCFMGCAKKIPDILRTMPVYAPIEEDTSATFSVADAWGLMDGTHVHGGSCADGAFPGICTATASLSESMRSVGFTEIKWGAGKDGVHVKPDWIVQLIATYYFHEPYNEQYAYYLKVYVRVRKPGVVKFEKRQLTADEVRAEMYWDRLVYLTENEPIMQNRINSMQYLVDSDSYKNATATEQYVDFVDFGEKPRMFQAISCQIVEEDDIEDAERMNELHQQGVKLAFQNLMKNPAFRKALVKPVATSSKP